MMGDLSRRHAESAILNRRAILSGSFIFAALFCMTASAQPNPPVPGQAVPGCFLDDRFFEDEVWAKVGERTCLRCHSKDGDAADSEFVLLKPIEGDDEIATLARNREAFTTMATATAMGATAWKKRSFTSILRTM